MMKFKRLAFILMMILPSIHSMSQGTYTNPVWNHDWPDPTVWKGDDGFYYSIATGGGSIIRSMNLADWEDTGIRPFDDETFAKLHQYGQHLWAPDVTVVDGQRIAYVTMYNSSSDASIIALKETAMNKFTFASVITRGKDTKIEDTIDPEVVTDPKTGKVWFFFGSIGGIHRIELNKDGLSVKDGSHYEHVAGVNISEDGSRLKVFEGSYLHKHGKYWYLFVSSGWYNNSTYRLSVGRSKKLEGVFVDKEGRAMTEGNATVLLHSDDGDRFLGPGHCGEIFTDKKGDEFIVYHCHDKLLENGNPRPMLLQKLTWGKDGWPQIGTGKPVLTAESPQ